VSYAGTGPDGIIYRLTPQDDGSLVSFAVFDADEPEIATLLVGEDGSLYAGTADAEQARPGRLEDPAEEETGRPEPQAGEDDAEQTSDEKKLADGDAEMEEQAASEEEVEQADTEATEQPAEGELGDITIEPTPEQHDRLRELVRQRLLAARESGEMKAPRGKGGSGSPKSAAKARVAAAPSDKEGNAVYRIDTQGFVTEVFRESVTVLDIAQRDGILFIATGDEGQVYRVDSAAGQTVVLTTLEADQVPAMIVDGDNLLLGAANPAQLVSLGSELATLGTYTSVVLDAGQVSLWGMANVTATLPEGTSMSVETRSGNAADPELAAWSQWSAAHTLMPDANLPALQPREMQIVSPPARFLQYRLTLLGDDGQTPAVDRVALTYVVPNLKPKIASLTAGFPEREPGDTSPPPTDMTIEWEATDDNADELIYKLEYQPAGSDRWLVIADELPEASYEWDTRRVPDGRYLLRVTADDSPTNPADMALSSARRSDAVLIDHAAPTLDSVDVQVAGRTATITATAKDALSAVRAISYIANDAERYLPVLPEDLIYDSTRETIKLILPDLAKGAHVVTLRLSDVPGNTAYLPVMFEIE